MIDVDVARYMLKTKKEQLEDRKYILKRLCTEYVEGNIDMKKFLLGVHMFKKAQVKLTESIGTYEYVLEVD